MFGEDIQVNAQRHTIGGLSAHSDQPGLLDWYAQIENRPRTVLVHGEDDAREALAAMMRARFDCDVSLSRSGMEVEV